MAKKEPPLKPEPIERPNPNGSDSDKVIALDGMYQNYFLDYASYVILERAVPAIEDGFKPVQRRILHAMYEMHDGRYHKVANVIGQTMQYHPHGDAAIGDALVNLGQKDLLIDCQGNWGDTRTGDGAAAARYIEARLTKFALDVTFNPQTTQWQQSYDGRKKEPVNLPVKFPMILAQGVDGIAVGLSTKIMPHNFIELIKASIDVLKGKTTNVLPDFQNGGMMDATNYNGGKRGGKIRVRSKIEIRDKSTLVIKEIPYAVTTTDLIESILKATEKGQIKIKKVVDNTAKDVEVVIELQPNTSPDVTLDALYAFSDCEVSISPNACVIIDNKPHFLDVNELLRLSTANTKELLRQELEIRRGELEEKWHAASLEKIFIENRIYHQIEDAESWEQVLEIIPRELRKYVREPNEATPPVSDSRIALLRDITHDDVVRLTEIRIKRISKYNKFEADDYLQRLLDELVQVKHDLAHLTEYAVRYFDDLLKKYGKGRERRTEIRQFDTIQAAQVVANNAKLYVNRKDGFIGMGIKKDELVCDCADIDDVIVFRKDGIMQIVKISDKTFVGKDILHVAIWRKGDDRTTYNLIYMDGKTGISYGKRFNVTAITRATEYDLTQGSPNSKIIYFTDNPNGESEVVNILLSQNSTARNKNFDYDFSELAIKGRTSQGNIVSKYAIRKISQKSAGKSTLGAKKIWWDEITGKVNDDGRGHLLGEFDTGDSILILYKDGQYEASDFDTSKRIEPNDVLGVEKLTQETVISAVHFDGNKGLTMVKRFRIETTSLGQKFSYLTDHPKSQLLFASLKKNPTIKYSMKINSKKMEGEISVGDFIDIKGWKALGNRLTDQKITGVREVEKAPPPVSKPQNDENDKPDTLKPGDTIEFDFG
jgi:topoisomerase-4 subunit A